MSVFGLLLFDFSKNVILNGAVWHVLLLPKRTCPMSCFRELYLKSRGCSEESFLDSVLKETCYPLATRFFKAWNLMVPKIFDKDRAIILQVAEARDNEEFRKLLRQVPTSDFEPYDFLQGSLKVRMSKGSLSKLGWRVFRHSGSSGRVTLAWTDKTSEGRGRRSRRAADS